MAEEDTKSRLLDSINEIAHVSILSNASSFLQSFSLNSSGDIKMGLKRKLEESDREMSVGRKEVKLGSPLMSPWEFRRLRADLIDAKSQIVRLEDRIDQLHKQNKESVIFFDREKSEMKTQLDSNRRTIQTLERKLQKIRTREAEALEQLHEFKKNQSISRVDKDQRLVRLEIENEELKDQVKELSGNGDNRIKTLLEELESLKKELSEVKLSAAENKDMADNLIARLAVALEDCKDLEELRLELQKTKDLVKELQSERDELDEARVIATILQDRVLRLDEIEKELKLKNTEIDNLKLAVENKVLMEEKVYDLELKLSVISEREHEYISLKEKNFDLETEVDKWVALAEGFCDNGTRDALQQYITDLKEKQLSYALERNNLKAEAESAFAKLKSFGEFIESSKKAEVEMKETLERQATEVRLLRRKVALVTRERDSYRQQLDMFEKDLTVSGMFENVQTFDPSQQERVNQLEGVIQEYRQLVNGLEQQLKEYQKDDAEARIKKTKELEQELQNVKENLEIMTRRKDELEELLEEKVKRGEHLSPGTRVLHFRNNPFSVADEKMKEDSVALRRECEKLKARIRLLESGEHFDLTVRATADVESGQAARIRDLEEQLESVKLKSTRYKEIFKQTSQEFRDVCYMLLGYRIDLLTKKVYRLSNMYSEDPNDHLMFQLNKAGMMEMIETPFAESLSDLVNEHLHRNKSIPCFLSALTLGMHETAESAQSDEDDDDEDDQPEEVEISD